MQCKAGNGDMDKDMLSCCKIFISLHTICIHLHCIVLLVLHEKTYCSVFIEKELVNLYQNVLILIVIFIKNHVNQSISEPCNYFL